MKDRKLMLQECRDIVAHLSRHFKMRRPAITIGNKNQRRSLYYPDRRAISIAPRAKNPVDSVLHEFAHYMEFSRNGDNPAEGNKAHGPYFVRCLVDAAEAWYGDYSKYNWRREYKQVINIYRKRWIKGNELDPPAKPVVKPPELPIGVTRYLQF